VADWVVRRAEMLRRVSRRVSGPREHTVEWPKTFKTIVDGFMELATLQDLMSRTYGRRNEEHGVSATLACLLEELGELARAVRKGDRQAQLHEIGDAMAWLVSLTNQLHLSLDEAAARYQGGCPSCSQLPCACL
jgi:NTP pyrophosphatase (non-canonical NTP hydrolase)